MRDESNENFKHNSKVPTYPCYMYEMMINNTIVNKILEQNTFIKLK